MNAVGIRRCYSTASKLTTALRSIQKAFPDKYSLHDRIDLALSSKGNVRVAIIPFQCHRTNISGVLNAILADPLASEQSWYDQFKNRLLAKDGLIKYSPTFDHVLTHNSLVEFPAPFKDELPHNREIEILEANSYKDSYGHIKSCHLHVFVSNNAHQAITHKIPSHYPSKLVLDMSKIDPDLDLGTVVSSSTAQKGVDLMMESPANATQYHTLYDQSNISQLERIIFQDPHVHERNLLESIVSTCEEINEPTSSKELSITVDAENERVTDLRKNWAQSAHQELQTTLTNGLDRWSKQTMAWWKLYYKVDDINDSLRMTLPALYLPQSKTNLDYLLGRIDAFADRHYLSSIDQDGPPHHQGSSLISKSLNEALSSEAVTLHNSGIKSLASVIFGLQLPTTLIPLLGVYFYDFSWYSMGSIIGLGLVLGLRSLQMSWMKACKTFKLNVLEKARQTLVQCEQSVFQRWEAKVVAQQDFVKQRQTHIKHLKDAMNDL